MIHPWMSLYFAQRAERMQRIRIQKYVYIHEYIQTTQLFKGWSTSSSIEKMAPSSPAQLPKPPDQVSSCIKVYRKICPLIESKESFLEWNTSRSVPIHHQIKSYLNQLLKKSYQMTFTTVTWFRNPEIPNNHRLDVSQTLYQIMGYLPYQLVSLPELWLPSTSSIISISCLSTSGITCQRSKSWDTLEFLKIPTFIIAWKKRKHMGGS